MRDWRGLAVVSALWFVGPASAQAQQAEPSCRFICDLEWKFEPTFTIENLAHRHRVMGPDAITKRVNRELDDANHWSFSFVIVIPIAPF